MRVLLLNPEYPPLGGGTALAAESLARGLARCGAMVDFVAVGEGEARVSEIHWDGTASAEGSLTLHRVGRNRTGCPQGIGGMLRYGRSALPLCRSLARAARYDVVQVFSPLSTGAILPFLDRRHTPVVVSLLAADVPGYDSSQRAAERLHRPLSRWIWRRADRVVVASDSLGRLARRTAPGLRYSVIYHGVDLARFRPRAAHHLRKDEKIRCLAGSRLIRGKGLADLIRAISCLESGRFELEILGSGPVEDSLKALVSSLGLGDRVTFSGALDRGQIARRYRSADLFAVASWDEAFDSGLAEALASGLPIVGPKPGSMPGLVQQGRNGLLVPPRDPAALAGAIVRLADDSALRGKLGQRNRAEAEATLSWEQVTARYLSIYQGIQRRAPARPLLAELPTSSW